MRPHEIWYHLSQTSFLLALCTFLLYQLYRPEWSVGKTTGGRINSTVFVASVVTFIISIIGLIWT